MHVECALDVQCGQAFRTKETLSALLCLQFKVSELCFYFKEKCTNAISSCSTLTDQ